MLSPIQKSIFKINSFLGFYPIIEKIVQDFSPEKIVEIIRS